MSNRHKISLRGVQQQRNSKESDWMSLCKKRKTSDQSASSTTTGGGGSSAAPPQTAATQTQPHINIAHANVVNIITNHFYNDSGTICCFIDCPCVCVVGENSTGAAASSMAMNCACAQQRSSAPKCHAKCACRSHNTKCAHDLVATTPRTTEQKE